MFSAYAFRVIMFGPTASPVVKRHRTWHIGPTTCVFASHALWRPKAREMIGQLMEARDRERLRQELHHGVRLEKSLGLDVGDVQLPF